MSVVLKAFQSLTKFLIFGSLFLTAREAFAQYSGFTFGHEPQSAIVNRTSINNRYMFVIDDENYYDFPLTFVGYDIDAPPELNVYEEPLSYLQGNYDVRCQPGVPNARQSCSVFLIHAQL